MISLLISQKQNVHGFVDFCGNKEKEWLMFLF